MIDGNSRRSHALPLTHKLGAFIYILKAPSNSVHPRSRAEWRAWLQKHSSQTQGVWLVSFKKATGKPCLEYDEIVAEALCLGWIDSKPNKLDDARSMLWLAPRKSGTGWSGANKNRVEKLIGSGRMTAAGLAKIEAAKQDGTWYLLDSIEALEISPDLGKALSAGKTAKGYFDAFPRSVKRAILEWIAGAKRPEACAKRIAETVESAARNVRANQWRQ